jgi:hypothetical protein
MADSMKKYDTGTKNIIAAIILGICIIAASYIHAKATRYVHTKDLIILDKWTGKIEFQPFK